MSKITKLIVNAPAVLNSPKALATAKAVHEKGQTKAKTAKSSPRQQKLAARIKAAQANKARLGAPSELARCRAIAGGDLRAGALLYRIAILWREINPKIDRGGKEWLAMTRDDWAISSGLSLSELKNYALPILQTYAAEIVETQSMFRGKDKKLGIRFDPIAFAQAKAEAGYELKVQANLASTSDD